MEHSNVTQTIFFIRSVSVTLALFAIVVLSGAINGASADTPKVTYPVVGNYDYSWLTSTSYRRGSTSRTTKVRTAETAFKSAEAELKSARTGLERATLALSNAWNQYFVEVDKFRLDNIDGVEVDAAWRALAAAFNEHRTARELETEKISLLREAKRELNFRRFFKASFDNEWQEVQASRGVRGVYTVADDIARCRPGGGRSCSASGLLRSDTRFTVFQPVLSTLGVHHAHAKGLTGAGVRVAIEDDAINYWLPEFAGRVSFKGARIVYPRPLTRRAPNGASTYWYIFSGYQRSDDDESRILLESITADLFARTKSLGYIRGNEDDRIPVLYLENRHSNVASWDRWVEIPAFWMDDSVSHGTSVASIAVGRDFGVAPGATLIPIFKDLSRAGQSQNNQWSNFLLNHIRRQPKSVREQWDESLAKTVRNEYQNYDVVNRSFGIGVFNPSDISAILKSGSNWWGEELRRILPLTWRAYMQTDVHPDDRAVVIYATGNESEEWGGLGADLPYYERHVRGHHLAVMAIDEDGKHASYTNFCGPLPNNWNASRWGRHYCLAAPGRVNAASNDERYLLQGIEGTSYAAPVVTGAVALLMEHFRGQLGNTEIAKRIVNTANNRGRYAQMEIYGAGLLDLRAALLPVGRLRTGTQSTNVDTTITAVRVPSAVGNLGQRLSASGVEVASLDALGAPFWASPEQFVRMVENETNVIPEFTEPDQDDQFNLGFNLGNLVNAESKNGFRLLMGSEGIGIAKVSRGGFHWSFAGDNASWHGGRTSGAFGNRVRSMTTQIGRSLQVELNELWNFDASATLGFAHPFFEPGSMLDVEPYVMSGWELGLERGEKGRGKWSRISFSQPIRAESGEAVFNYLSGLKNGEPNYDQAAVSLAPEGRELELALTHEAPIGRGRGVIEVAHSWDAGHERGRESSRIGFAYRLHW